jgi:hypothetical protein
MSRISGLLTMPYKSEQMLVNHKTVSRSLIRFFFQHHRAPQILTSRKSTSSSRHSTGVLDLGQELGQNPSRIPLHCDSRRTRSQALLATQYPRKARSMACRRYPRQSHSTSIEQGQGSGASSGHRLSQRGKRYLHGCRRHWSS